MAKKTTKSAAKTKAPAKKAAKKKAPAKKVERIEIELDPTEADAFELAHSSDKVCAELEEAVTAAVSQAVRKVFKKNHISLTAQQAEEVALVLFAE